MTYVEVSDTIRAPRDEVFSLVRNYESWPRIFPHIKSVRLVRQMYGETLLELVSAVGGRVMVAQRTRPWEKIVEDLRRGGIRGKNIYTFKPLPEGTRVTLEFDARFRGVHKILGPFVKSYIRKQLLKLVLGPMKRAAEDSDLIGIPRITQMCNVREFASNPSI